MPELPNGCRRGPGMAAGAVSPLQGDDYPHDGGQFLRLKEAPTIGCNPLLTRLSSRRLLVLLGK